LAIRTFLDTGILLAAHRGVPPLRESARAILNDKGRTFIGSAFLYLETMPKAVHHRNASEVEFYRTFFDNVQIWIGDVESIVTIATEDSERSGLAAMDALHVAAAYLGEAEVFLTTESPRKSIHRTKLIPVVSIQP